MKILYLLTVFVFGLLGAGGLMDSPARSEGSEIVGIMMILIAFIFAALFAQVMGWIS